MQCSIDNAKRQFDIDIDGEIKRIKKDMDIKANKYPAFWSIIKKNFNKKLVNKSLVCPMNYLYDLKFDENHPNESTLPMSYFFEKSELRPNYITCRRIEELITKYSFELYEYGTGDDNSESLLLRSDFESLVNDIKGMNIPNKYWGLFSWLIDRAFLITCETRRKSSVMKCRTNKNKSILIKVLFNANRNNLLRCFSKNLS